MADLTVKYLGDGVAIPCTVKGCHVLLDVTDVYLKEGLSQRLTEARSEKWHISEGGAFCPVHNMLRLNSLGPATWVQCGYSEGGEQCQTALVLPPGRTLGSYGEDERLSQIEKLDWEKSASGICYCPVHRQRPIGIPQGMRERVIREELRDGTIMMRWQHDQKVEEQVETAMAAREDAWRQASEAVEHAYHIDVRVAEDYGMLKRDGFVAGVARAIACLEEARRDDLPTEVVESE